MPASTKKVCVDLLREELSEPIRNASRAYRVIERLAHCLIALADGQQQIEIKLYGNGIPGGIEAKVDRMGRDIDELKGLILNQFGDDKYGRRKGDLPVAAKADDSFTKTVDWFVNRILPPLLTALIIGVANIILFVAAIMTGISFGVISVP